MKQGVDKSELLEEGIEHRRIHDVEKDERTFLQAKKSCMRRTVKSENDVKVCKTDHDIITIRSDGDDGYEERHIVNMANTEDRSICVDLKTT